MLFRKSKIYRVGLELARTSKEIIESLPKGQGELADQLRRASLSLVLNFAEGCGRSSPAERKRFFSIARGSAHEIAAAVEVGSILGLIATPQAQRAQDQTDHICAMLWRFT